MLFHLEETPEGYIFGWVLPDNPGTVPAIKLSCPGREVREVAANYMRTDLRDKGLHETGMAGFNLTKENTPDLPAIIDRLEIRDTDKNVLLFRHFNPEKHLELKLFRYDLSAFPTRELDVAFAERFTFHYTATERHPYDTLFGMLNNQVAKSLYAAGRPSFQRFEHLLGERGFKTAALVRDPYEEMAERLLFALFVSRPNSPHYLAERLTGLESLQDLVKPVDFSDPDSVRFALKNATDKQWEALANPFVRTLACSPDETPKRAHVEIALYKLSIMDVVCLRSRFSEFKAMLAEVLGTDILGDQAITDVTAVSALARSLAESRMVRDLLALDLDFYSYAEEAILRVLDKRPMSPREMLRQ